MMTATDYSFKEKFKVLSAAPTAYYVSEFITEIEEKYLLRQIYAAPKPKWTQLSNRRLQNWGGVPHSKGMIAETIPPWLNTYLEKIHSLDLMGGNRPNHILVNEYTAGQGIMPHLDGSLFYPTITTVSVGSHCILKFTEPSDEKIVEFKPVFSFLLEPRSLLVLQDKMFGHYLHCIEEVAEDSLDDSIVNLNMCSDVYKTGTALSRDTRVSLTIRHVPKTTIFKLKIGNQRLLRGINSSNVTGRCFCSNQDACEEGGTKLDGNKKGVVVGVYTENKKLELTPAAQEIDQKASGKISQQLNELSCQMKLGNAFVVTDVPEYSAVALACLGPKEPGYDDLEALDVTKENVRWGVGAGVRALHRRCCGQVLVDAAGAPGAAAEAAELAAWSYQEFKTTDLMPECSVSELGAGAGSAGWRDGACRGRAQNWARQLSDTPANVMTPVDLAQAAIDVLCPLGVTVEARGRDWIEAQDMQAFLAVARGSCTEPMFIECSYKGAGAGAPVLLAAKGVTFDSGGLCLKQCASMTENRGSMAGAAVVLAAIRACAELKVSLNIRAVIPCCENMVSGQSMKVGDVVRALNGRSILIEDTDMEGRLMLADALVYGQVTYKPELVIDVATLTHGVALATGGGAFGCFTSSEEAWGSLRRAGADSGDRPWRLPLWNYYTHQVTDDPSVDLRNKGSGKATPCLGAAFLKSFVCCDWMHLDITGVGKVAHDAAPYLRARRMTGRPARALTALLHNIAQDCNKETKQESSQPQSRPPCDNVAANL